MGLKANDIKKALLIVEELTPKQRSYFSKSVSSELIKKWVEAEYHYFKWCNKSPYSNYTNEKISEDLNKYYLNKDGIIRNLSDFNNIKKALKKGKLVISHKGGLKWDVHFLHKNDMAGISLIFKKVLCGYPLSYETQYYTMSCYGTSRPLEIIMGFGYSLGLKFSNIKQSQIIH